MIMKDELWGALKYSGKVHKVFLDDTPGYALEDNTVVVVRDMSWCKVASYARFNEDSLQYLEEPLFKTLDTAFKIGRFDEVFKRGYIVFPLEGMHDMQNNPVLLRKGNK
jgi:hypothetical protein